MLIRVSKFLLTYRLTPHLVTEEAPSKLMLGNIIRSSLDLVQPNLRNKVVNNQFKQKEYSDLHKISQESHKKGDYIWIKQFVGNQSGFQGRLGDSIFKYVYCKMMNVDKYEDVI